MSLSHKADRLLIVHDGAEPYLGLIERRFPDLEIFVADGTEPIADVLAQARPSVVFAFKCAHYTEPVYEPVFACASVEWVQNAGAGIDHLPDWDSKRMVVTSASGVLTPFMVETVIGMMLMMNFGLVRYLRQQQMSEWRQHPWTSLRDKTLLIVGLGSIGSLIGERARAFGMKTIGVRNTDAPSNAVDEVVPRADLLAALPRADFVCLHVPDTPDTHHLIDAKALAAMKPDAYLINTSRGAVVDERALIDALREGEIAGAYLDVFDAEPLPAEHPLWQLDNVVITPHVSDSVADWEVLMARFFCDNLRRRLNGEPLLNQVDPQKRY